MVFEEDYAQRSSTISSLRAILEAYSLSIGIFRELLQNSDDARASKQVFVLDRRNHADTGLYHSGLAAMQGAALLAYNDAVFGEDDWKAAGTMNDSSKSDDTSKIGKYGVGFRAVFNISDCPQVLSGDYLAIFDPLRSCFDSEGKRLGLSHISATFPNQLAPYSFFRDNLRPSSFNGTIIRCPLRQEAGKICAEVVGADTIAQLLAEFIEQEMDISLLFLQHIKRVEIYDIDSAGNSILLAEMTISRSNFPSLVDTRYHMLCASVDFRDKSVTLKKEWHVLRANFTQEEAEALLAKQLGSSPASLSSILKVAKFVPEVGLAVDLSGSSRGRLFTYLPLPIFSGFPVHIHGLFAIDASRRYLKRANELGLQLGSRDHTLVNWNHLLFDTFIPRTWSVFIEMLVSNNLVSDVFKLWPPYESEGELHSYCSSTARRVLEELVASDAAVWPVYHAKTNIPAQYGKLSMLIVAQPSLPRELLHALQAMGLALTSPPDYICKIISASPGSPVVLSPEVVHDRLMEHITLVSQASDAERSLVLEYLLSNGKVENICGLPLISTVNGQKANLISSELSAVVSYTMLSRVETDIFGPCDEDAIPLKSLSTRVQSALLKSGPEVANVKPLEIPRIIHYLSQYRNRLGLYLSEGKKDPDAVKWLSNFWEWFGTYNNKEELFPRIRDLFLLPSTKGLMTAERPLFKLRAQHPKFTSPFLSLGVPFLDSTFSEPAHEVLKQYGLVTAITNVQALLDALPTSPPDSPPEPRLCEDALKFLADKLDLSLGNERISRLKRLPLFPVLSFSAAEGLDPKIVKTWSAITDGYSIRSVGKPTFVPSLDRVLFVDLDSTAATIIRVLQPDFPRPYDDTKLLELAVEHFTTQTEHLQVAALDFVVRRRRTVPPYIMDKFREQPFVYAQDGSLHKPGDLVDPDSSIALLYAGSRDRFPRSDSPFEILVVRNLRALEMMKSFATHEIVKERIGFISSRHSSQDALVLARSLMSLIVKSHLDFSGVQLNLEARWLPTTVGVRSAKECRDAANISPALFDQVLNVLEVFEVPHSLRGALGWNQPLATAILIQQLDRVLNSGQPSYDTVAEIIRELGRRKCSQQEIDALESLTRGRSWIPTTVDSLSDTRSVVFKWSPSMLNSGFYQVKTDMKVEAFLRRLGCTDSPTPKAIIEKLHDLIKDTTSLATVDVALSLLKLLPEDLSDIERTKLLIPDHKSILQPSSKVFFNDIGDKAVLVATENQFIAHAAVTEALARKLGLKHLGLEYVELRNVGPNMGQAPITTVRHNLERYTTQQFLLEFLANAADAKATSFNVALNNTSINARTDWRVLSEAMVYLCSLPSLVVHNNAQFTKEDFDGICYTSVGGKKGRKDTIGEFGLGVLTMYHFTDVAIVISGSHVLFMDPSKKHLPLEDCASLILPLKHVQRFYPDHLLPIDGLFGFDTRSDCYEGTLFLLPLRGGQSLPDDVLARSPTDCIVREFWPEERVLAEVLEPFKKFATDCLLFTELTSMSCIVWQDKAVVKEIWSLCAERGKTFSTEEDAIPVKDIEITYSSGNVASAWKTVTVVLSPDQVPAEFGPLNLRRSPFAGLAARYDKPSPQNTNFNFFSTLPLASITTLPMHIMASFLLSSDRRQIRVDRYEELPAKFNIWLLQQVIPPLYMSFMEQLLIAGDLDYHQRWPSARADDALSQEVVKGFYSDLLKQSSKRIFSNNDVPPQRLTPQEAVLSGDEPPSIFKAVTLLASTNLVELPSVPSQLAKEAGIAGIDAAFLRAEILHNPAAITTRLDFQVLADIVHFITKESAENLLGLEILPLQDETFGKFDVNGSGTIYHVWKPKDRNRHHNFPKSQFVHPRVKTKDLLKLELNIAPLDPTSIRNLVEHQLSTFSSSETPIREQNAWIQAFWDSWDEYAALGLTPHDLTSLPLIPTIDSHPFVSFDQCKEGTAFLVRDRSHDHEQQQNLRTCLHQLGLNVVNPDGEATPPALRAILRNEEYPDLQFEQVLLALSLTQRPLGDLFTSLGTNLQGAFAHWARSNVPILPTNLLPPARELPIWSSARNGSASALRAASEVRMLPTGLSVGVAASFVNVFVANHHPSLSHLGCPELSFEDIKEMLQSMTHLADERQLEAYKRCFDKWIALLPLHYDQPVPVPTVTLAIRPSNELYAREPLFDAVFGNNSPNFIHRDFQNLPRGCGLRREENLDFDMFLECAQGFTPDMQDPQTTIRARELFRVYSLILPLRVSAQDRNRWTLLNDLAFIPRRVQTLRRLEGEGNDASGLDIPNNVTMLDPVVEPSELVREEFEAVAWSQKAAFEQQPDRRILTEYPDLGRPSFSEVIAHLHYLAALHPLRLSQRHVLLHDLQETYTFLNDHLGLLQTNPTHSEQILSQLRTQPLFLNVDDPYDETWKWETADSLAFDAEEVENGPIRRVREFLLQYDQILTAAGVIHVHHPRYTPQPDQSLSGSAKLQAITSGFDELRKNKTLTDVVFITANDTDTERLVAHRTFLAVVSDYFKTYFFGGFLEERDASSSDPIPVDVSQYSRQCVGSILECIYTGRHSVENPSLELLLETLELSNYWRILEVFDDAQKQIVNRRLLNPDTLDRIRSKAEDCSAAALISICKEYEHQNPDFIQKLRAIQDGQGT